MKRSGILAIIAISVALVGCVVSSVYPYYTEKDLVFEPALVGKWSDAKPDADGKEAWVFEKGEDKDYTFNLVGENKTNKFSAHLFKLKDQLFLDFVPLEQHEDYVPPHYLMKVTQIQPTLKTAIMDYEWLGKLVEKEPQAVRHMLVPTEPGKPDNVRLVLTADTQELQNFVLKHLDTEGAFKEATEMKRWKTSGHP